MWFWWNVCEEFDMVGIFWLECYISVFFGRLFYGRIWKNSGGELCWVSV